MSDERIAGQRKQGDERAALFEAPDDIEAINRLYHGRRWSAGLPAVPPTVERVQRMLARTRRPPGEVVANVAPGFGAATVERIAINAVMAGCEPEYLPVVLAAVDAVAAPEFNLQGIQATTNPVAVWVIVNGPMARRAGVNGGFNCLGQGTPANASIGRVAPGSSECRRRVARRDGPRNAWPAGQVHLLLRRERGGEPMGAAARRARLQARR